MIDLPITTNHELVQLKPGRRTGLPVMIAVHSTLLGPAVGGLRITRYSHSDEALADVLRLSRAMTVTAAAVDNGTGGGNAIVPLPWDLELSPGLREAILLDVADHIHILDGKYLASPDVGTSARDIDVIRRRTPYVAGYSEESGGAGGTAYGTFLGLDAAIRLALRRWLKRGSLEGMTICIVGLGAIGSLLAQAYADEGARLVVTDIDPSRKALADEVGAHWVSPNRAMSTECDLLVPCALGGILSSSVVPRLKARIVCGAAINQLTEDDVAQDLLRHNILYVPDFIANAGGLVFASAIELHHKSEATAEASTRRKIENNVELILSSAESLAITPLEAALRIAQDRLAQSFGRPV
jgi:leucine dehydrogenase